MKIYVTYGKWKSNGNTTIIKAFPTREQANEFCEKENAKRNGYYKDIVWEDTELV